MRFLCIIFFMAVNLPLNAQEKDQPIPVVNGVSWELASYRHQSISNINYDFDISIPPSIEDPITANEKIAFNLSDIANDLQIDFKEDSDKINQVKVNGSTRPTVHYNEHIVVDKKYLKLGRNSIEIRFTAGDGALNRNKDYLYTLFVPDRMRTSFPSFDQPNLKATFDLTLTMPVSWNTISGAPIRIRNDRTFRSTVRFERSNLMSTYLFSFVAGRFEEITRNVDGIEMTMLHREPDESKVKHNVDAIFQHHKTSIDYMEEYTGIKFPFKKFGFALIPSFQFGGMEHVGAIQYKARSLMLDIDPPKADLLGRAALIGHETAHMWFGDLVTMDWFNDVWTKEVFANFMSAKLVNPSFPEINHDLRFQLRLHPGAYAVDRSEGPNPIRQKLPNLNEAGSMYGAIIYNKAPIMMRQLEKMLGEENFRDGIREYLNTYSFGNATWPNLIEILDKRSADDLKQWSEVWVNTSGRPVFNVVREMDNVVLSQQDPANMNRKWPQIFEFKNGGDPIDISFSKDAVKLKANSNETFLVNSNGFGYGLFPIEKEFITEKWSSLSDLEKASAFVNLYEQLLEGNGTINAIEYIELLIWSISYEENSLIINHLMRQLTSIYWSLLAPDERIGISPALETALWDAINAEGRIPGDKKVYFKAYANIALTGDTLERLVGIWDETIKVEGLLLSVRDYTDLSAQLAIKLPDQADSIVSRQATRIKTQDRARRFAFIRFALSPDQNVRGTFFETLKNEKNRQTEAWVLTALSYLHHPLRAEQSEKFILPSLELLQEIQITGDIFFPGRWLGTILRNYQSDSAVKTVRDFLSQRPDYNNQLRMKILQSADQLFRANKIVKAGTI